MDDRQNKPPALWDIIPQFFLVPLKGVGGVALLVVSLLAAYFSSIYIQIMLLFAVIKYGMEILENTAQGQVEAPEFSSKVVNENYELPFKQLLIFVLPYFLLYQADNYIAYIIVLNVIIFYLFALPASVMTLAYTHSAFAAINPVRLISLIARLGWSYAILYVFLLLLNGGASAAYYLIFSNSLNSFTIFFSLMFQIYFAWVMYAMMGYVLYQHHEDIGYDLPEDSAEHDEQTVALTGFEKLVAEEDYRGAQAALKEIILQDPDNLDLRKKFHKIVKMSGHDKQLTMHAITLIGRLLDAKQLVEAVNVYLDCIKVDADFKPENHTHYLPLVEEMRRRRLYKEAVALSNGFHKQYPQSEFIPHLYLLVSKIFIDDLSQNDKAKTILAFLKQKYIGHEIQIEVDQYTSFLTKVTV